MNKGAVFLIAIIAFAYFVYLPFLILAWRKDFRDKAAEQAAEEAETERQRSQVRRVLRATEGKLASQREPPPEEPEGEAFGVAVWLAGSACRLGGRSAIAGCGEALARGATLVAWPVEPTRRTARTCCPIRWAS